MDILDSKRLDHLGVVAGTMADLGLANLIDKKIPPSDSQKISAGQAVTGMIINSLGFTSRPLSLTPQFFESKALDLLFEKPVEFGDLNRHRLGRCLDEIHEYGCEMLFHEVASEVCVTENVDNRFVSLDTTSFSLSGSYDVDTDESVVEINHGYSKDHRPDLKQVVLELLVSQDGGFPLVSKSFDGNASDNTVFKERCEQLIDQFKCADGPRYLVADSKLYHKENAENLSSIKFITRIPRTYKEEALAVSKALSANSWNKIDANKKYYEHENDHFGIQQRWLVIYSEAARERSKKTLEKWVEKEKKKIAVDLKHLRNKEFKCKSDASTALLELGARFKYHNISEEIIETKENYAGKGRPSKDAIPESLSYFISASFEDDEGEIKRRLDEKSCFIVGTNVNASELSAIDVIDAYKNQNASIERGFRFLKDPYFFTSTFFLKKPSRIMALLMVMTLALLIYSVAQRRIRATLLSQDETLPNQINKEIQTPTLRWIFQMLDGINVVYSRVKGKVEKILTGITDLKRKILGFFCPPVRRIYGLE